MADQGDVRRIALSLPEVVDEGDGYRVGGKLFAWTWLERIEPKRARVPQPAVLVVQVSDRGEKQAILESDDRKFFTEAHYDNYPAVLIRLAEIDVAELTELITEAWRVRAPKRLHALIEDADGAAR